MRQLGGFPERTPLNARTVGRFGGEGYRVENVVFESRPGHHVTANLYLPDSKGPFPGCLCPSWRDPRFNTSLRHLGLQTQYNTFWWFDRNDTANKRAVLQVHAMGNRDNPLTGVFATRSPMRPNLIALTLCKVVAVKDNLIEIEKTDAFDGTPILDIKPFISGYDTTDNAKMPEWLERAREQRQAK